MPALVAPERLDDLVVGGRVDGAGPVEVGDRGGRELEVAEAGGEGVLIVAFEELTGEDQQGELEPGLVELVPGAPVDRAEVHAMDCRPEAGVDRVDAQGGPHGSVVLMAWSSWHGPHGMVLSCHVRSWPVLSWGTSSRVTVLSSDGPRSRDGLLVAFSVPGADATRRPRPNKIAVPRRTGSMRVGEHRRPRRARDPTTRPPCRWTRS